MVFNHSDQKVTNLKSVLLNFDFFLNILKNQIETIFKIKNFT